MPRSSDLGNVLGAESRDHVFELASFNFRHLLGFLNLKTVCSTNVVKFSLSGIVDSLQFVFLEKVSQIEFHTA